MCDRSGHVKTRYSNQLAWPQKWTTLASRLEIACSYPSCSSSFPHRGGWLCRRPSSRHIFWWERLTIKWMANKQHIRCKENFDHPLFIPKQPEDTRSELLWKNQYSTVQQLPADGAKRAWSRVSACRFGTTKASKRCLASSPFISRWKRIFRLLGYIPKIIEDAGRRRVNETAVT